MTDRNPSSAMFQSRLLNAINIRVNDQFPPNSFMMVGDHSATIYNDGKLFSVAWDRLVFSGNELKVVGLRFLDSSTTTLRDKPPLTPDTDG